MAWATRRLGCIVLMPYPGLVHADELPGIGQLSIRVITAREINRAAGLPAAHHATRVRAVRGDDFAVGQTHVREKAFVTLNEGAADQTRRKTHGRSNIALTLALFQGEKRTELRNLITNYPGPFL